jgi:hypothetical protein
VTKNNFVVGCHHNMRNNCITGLTHLGRLRTTALGFLDKKKKSLNRNYLSSYRQNVMGCVCAAIKLYLHKQAGGHICSRGYSWPTPDLGNKTLPRYKCIAAMDTWGWENKVGSSLPKTHMVWKQAPGNRNRRSRRAPSLRRLLVLP